MSCGPRRGEERILLAPELLNNLAASFVLEARRNPKGLGSLEEKRLLAGQYPFRELEALGQEEREMLLDSAARLFLEHNICFRESDPLGGQSYLVFPELINLKKPALEHEEPVEEGVSYTVSGAVENVYASLVVLLGYTPMFTRTDQWRSQSRYVVGDAFICGFRQDAERDGELDLVLYFGANVGRPVRTLFQGLFESFLARRNLSVSRFEPVVCPDGHALNRAIVREQSRAGKQFAFCPECGLRAALPRADEPIQLEQAERRRVDEQRWFAGRRSRFERALFRVSSYAERRKLARPDCFISYAWGDKDQELWVERNLAADLAKAGIGVILDRWENARIGASVTRFIEQIEKCDFVIVVGTPLYRKKYDNKETATGYAVAAEGDLISNRLTGTEGQKESVLPLLLQGEKATSLPPLLHGRVFADFRKEIQYFATALDLILSLYQIPFNNPAVADLRESFTHGNESHGIASNKRRHYGLVSLSTLRFRRCIRSRWSCRSGRSTGCQVSDLCADVAGSTGGSDLPQLRARSRIRRPPCFRAVRAYRGAPQWRDRHDRLLVRRLRCIRARRRQRWSWRGGISQPIWRFLLPFCGASNRLAL